MTSRDATNDESKLCRDCKWAEPWVRFFFVKNYELGMCGNPKQGVRLSDGAVAKQFCDNTRAFDNPKDCGPQGKWWERK